MEDGKSDMFSYACGDGDVWGNFFHFCGVFLHGKKFEVNLHLDVFTAAAAADLKDNYFYTSPICPGMNPTCCCLFKMLPY